MGISNRLSCETGSFSHCHNPHRILQPEVLKLWFPALELWFAQFVLLLSCSYWLIHMWMWDYPVASCRLGYLVCQLPLCSASCLPQLPISAPPTSLDKCFFFNSLVVRLLHNLIFWWFWLFLFLNWLLSFFRLCEEAKHIYLHLHLGWKSCFQNFLCNMQ